jgi:DNA-binding beta-propeller fold protein YncE
MSGCAPAPFSAGSTESDAGDAGQNGDAALVDGAEDSLVVVGVSEAGPRRNHAVRQIVIATGQVTTVAGGTMGTANGTILSAKFLQPLSVAYDRDTLYVADGQDDVIRKIDLATGMVTTLVGLSGQSGSTDGDASSATFNSPFSLLADGLGSLYVVEAKRFLEYRQTDPGLLRRIDLATATVSTMAGTRGEVGVAPGPTPSTLNCPTGLALTSSGDTLVSDPCDGVVVRLSAL